MPVLPENPFKGRQYPGDVILMAVRWYLRYPLAYEHVAELLAERGLAVDRSCVWRWVQAYAPEINKRCRPHLKPTNKESVRTGGSPGGEDQPIGILNSCPAHELSALPIAADFSTE
jgi:hypothetical protein